MNPALVGALAAAVAVMCLVLVPLGVPPASRQAIGHPERRVLREAGWTRSLVAWESLRVLSTLCGLAIAGAFDAAPLGLAGAVVPSLAARARALRRRDEAARETVAILQMALAGLRSGASLPEALRLASASADELAAAPFTRAVRAFDLGAPLDAALARERAGLRDGRVTLALEALSLGVAERLPASRCADLVASAVDRLVFEQRTRDEVHARTAGLRAQIVLLAMLVPALALYLVLTLPGLSETLATPLARFVLIPLAAVLEIAGILASRGVAGAMS